MRTPHRVKWIGRPLGKDNYEVYLRYAGLTQSQVNELKDKGVI
jgi:crotonobetainyl-CoA:carnitine CoA-transferase CaiB-like acyl-CoA transferase